MTLFYIQKVAKCEKCGTNEKVGYKMSNVVFLCIWGASAASCSELFFCVTGLFTLATNTNPCLGKPSVRRAKPFRTKTETQSVPQESDRWPCNGQATPAATVTCHLAVFLRASAGLDWLHHLLCEFMLDEDGVDLIALWLGRSSVVFGTDSNVQNMPIQWGLKPFGETAVPLKNFLRWDLRVLFHSLMPPAPVSAAKYDTAVWEAMIGNSNRI